MGWFVALITICLPILITLIMTLPLRHPASITSGQDHSSKLMRFKPPLYIEVFQCAYYYSALARRRMLIWDYRDHNGVLHSGVAASHEQAVEAAKKFGYAPDNGDEDYPEIE